MSVPAKISLKAILLTILWTMAGSAVLRWVFDLPDRYDSMVLLGVTAVMLPRATYEAFRAGAAAHQHAPVLPSASGQKPPNAEAKDC
jgi:hypothetical protein